MVEEKKTDKKDENCVYVGSKPFPSYLTAITTQVNKSNKVTVKSRGKFTAKAIDLSLASIRINGYKLVDVKINTSKFINKEEREVNVSSIDIQIKK